MSENTLAEEAIDRAMALLMEHFDAVQVLCCRLEDDGGTSRIFKGRGLWHARAGMAAEFLAEDKAQLTAREIAQNPFPPEDDGTSWRDD